MRSRSPLLGLLNGLDKRSDGLSLRQRAIIGQSVRRYSVIARDPDTISQRKEWRRAYRHIQQLVSREERKPMKSRTIPEAQSRA